MFSSTSRDGLSDFRTNRRVLWLAALAVPIGVIAALVAKALLWLIAVITNLVFLSGFHRRRRRPRNPISADGSF